MPEPRQSPRQRSTCPASQGLPGAGGKGAPEVKGLPPAGLGLWQALFRSASPVSGKATRPGGTGKPSCPPGGSPGSAAPNRRSKHLRLEGPGARGRDAPARRRSGALRALPERGLTQAAEKPDPRGRGSPKAVAAVAPASSLFFPELVGKIKGRSFCPGHILGDATAPSLSESLPQADSSLRVVRCCG